MADLTTSIFFPLAQRSQSGHQGGHRLHVQSAAGGRLRGVRLLSHQGPAGASIPVWPSLCAPQQAHAEFAEIVFVVGSRSPNRGAGPMWGSLQRRGYPILEWVAIIPSETG